MRKSEKALYSEGMDLSWTITDYATLGKSFIFLRLSVLICKLRIILPYSLDYSEVQMYK